MVMNRISSTLFCFVLLFAPVSGISADGKWVTCEGQAEVANITATEAVQIALTEARRNAIETVAGVQLASASIVQDFVLLSDVINSSSGVILSIRTDVVRSSSGSVLSPVILFRQTFTTFISRVFSPSFKASVIVKR